MDGLSVGIVYDWCDWRWCTEQATQVASCISVYVPGEYNAQQSRLDHWEVETFKVEVMLLDRSFPSFMDILC